MFTAINSEYHKLWYVQTMRYLVNNEKEKKKILDVSRKHYVLSKRKKKARYKRVNTA